MDGVAKVHETAQFLREYWETQTTQVSVLQASMADVVVAVQSVGGDVERSVTALRQEVTRTVESLEQNLASGLRRSFEEFDQELSQALHHLSSGVAALSDVVQEVRVPADHMRQLAKTTGALVQDFEKVAVSLSRASSTPSELDSDSLQMSTGEQT
jgi:vacuolar-type H+-ATPase catalytic subunit A/Vma1